jgi:hypothetical protein
MRDHQFGQQLRSQLLLDLQNGQPVRARRLQGLVADLCGQAQTPLVAPLRELMRTPVFLEALERRPVLPPDPQLAGTLLQAVNGEVPPPLQDRLQAVIQGLLAIPEPAVVVAQGGAQRGVVALLSFLAGALLVGVGVGVGIPWLLRLSDQPAPLPTPAPTAAEPPPVEPAAPAPPIAMERAISSVRNLYSELSAGDDTAAAQRVNLAVADQFDPIFFAQVDVSDLQVIGRSGSQLDLQGVVTFLYPDGSRQMETRTYRVDTSSEPPLITGSAFGRVISPRQ